MLKHVIRERGDIVVATLSGRLTLGSGDQVLRTLVEGLIAERRLQIVLDLAAVEFIDSSGLGELVAALKGVRAAGGKLKVLNPGGRVYDTLSLARLLPIFEVYDSEEEVFRSFATSDEPAAGPEIRFEVQDRVGIVRLNRPRRFNALTRSLLADLVALLAGVRTDKRVRALVLTGEGRAFCYGADVEELREGAGALPTLELFQTAIRDIALLPKPVLAAINGFATGAGLDLALACDLRVMSQKAKLASSFVKFGLVPDGGSTHHLPWLVGPARAAELVLTGRPVDAETALAWGLVNRVAAPAAVLEETLAWAGELCQGPARATGRAKLLLRTNPIIDLGSALAAEAGEQEGCFGEGEFHEGLRAHLEKREPCFPE